MSVQETLQKIKPFYTIIVLILAAVLFFLLGRLSAIEDRHQPIRILKSATAGQEGEMENAAAAILGANSASQGAAGTPVGVPTPTTTGEVIGSKSGKKYYFPWCGTVKRIKPENQVHFASIEAARAAGFTPGGNCKGLE